MTKVKAISFDVGNTLLKPKPDAEEIYYNIFRQHGCEMELSEVRQIFYRSLEEYERKIFKEDLDLTTDDGKEEEWWRRVDEVIAGRCGVKTELRQVCRQLWDEFKKESSWEPFSEVIEVLKKLKDDGYRLGVTTNWNSKISAILQAHRIGELLDFQVVSAEVGYKKPAVQIFEKAVELAGCKKEELVHVGDHLDTDYQGALRAEITAVLLDRGKKSKVVGPVISSLEQLPELLQSEIEKDGI